MRRRRQARDGTWNERVGERVGSSRFWAGGEEVLTTYMYVKEKKEEENTDWYMKEEVLLLVFIFLFFILFKIAVPSSIAQEVEAGVRFCYWYA